MKQVEEFTTGVLSDRATEKSYDGYSDVVVPSDLDIPARETSFTGGDFAFDLPPEGYPLEKIEKAVISKAMEKSDGCIAKAAKLLHTTYRTVEYRVKKYDIARTS